MTPEQVFGKLNKDIKGLTSGVASASVSGSSIIFTMNDGSTQTITFPQPKDGASIVAVSTNENNQFVFSMSDGTEIVGGEVPASSGVSKEYVDSELSKKANNSDIPTKVSGLQNDSNYQTDTDVATALTPYAKSADVTKEITNKVAEIIADAPEDFNTLKEMSDWISNHENDASAMNSAISDNKTAITALQTGKADKSEIPTELPANGGNADTVNGHTVGIDVPENAVFTDTIYDDTEVKGSIAELSSNLVEQKMLGWNVPSEFPIQNEVSGNQFIQKVGRADLGELAWLYTTNPNRFLYYLANIKSCDVMSIANVIVTDKLSVTTFDDVYSHASDNILGVSGQNIGVYASSYTDVESFKNDMKGVYLYYELETPITMTIDGNEAISKVNES